MSNTLNSGLKIFDVIKILLENPKSRDEIGFKLQENGQIKARRSISKYIKTLRMSGFDIRFEDDIFQIYNTPFKVYLTKEETEGLDSFNFVMGAFCREDETKRNSIEEKFSNITRKRRKLGDDFLKNSFLEPKDSVYNNIKALFSYISKENVRVCFKYKNKKYTVIPKILKYRINGIFLLAYETQKKKNFLFRIDLISSINFKDYCPNELLEKHTKTIFKITGRLMKNYILKEGERAHYFENEILVTNIFEDKKELFNRLVKYGKYCEVISDDNDRLKFIKKLEGLKRHYKSM